MLQVDLTNQSNSLCIKLSQYYFNTKSDFRKLKWSEGKQLSYLQIEKSLSSRRYLNSIKKKKLSSFNTAKCCDPWFWADCTFTPLKVQKYKYIKYLVIPSNKLVSNYILINKQEKRNLQIFQGLLIKFWLFLSMFLGILCSKNTWWW